MSGTKKFIVFMAGTTFVASSAFFLFPEVRAENLTFPLAIAFASSITQVGSVVYFLTSLGSFKKDLRKAYYLLASGVLLFSLVQLVPSLTVFVDFIGENVFIASAAFILPYTFGSLLMYLGMRKFARILQLRPLFIHVWGALLLAITVGVLFTLLPHPAITQVEESTLDLVIGLAAWCGAFSLAATILSDSVRRAIGAVYKRGLWWLTAALGVLAFTTLHEVIVKTYFLDSWYVATQASVWPFLVVGALFLRASLAFNEMRNQFLQLPQESSYVDVVVAMAQRVSKPEVIDVELDRVRQITARQAGSAALSASDKAVLVGVYKYLEDYLTTKEPLQTVSKEALRSSLPDNFLKDVEAGS